MLDDAVLTVLNSKGKRRPGKSDDKVSGSRTIINNRDPEGVRSLLRGMRPVRGSRMRRIGAKG